MSSSDEILKGNGDNFVFDSKYEYDEDGWTRSKTQANAIRQNTEDIKKLEYDTTDNRIYESKKLNYVLMLLGKTEYDAKRWVDEKERALEASGIKLKRKTKGKRKGKTKGKRKGKTKGKRKGKTKRRKH